MDQNRLHRRQNQTLKNYFLVPNLNEIFSFETICLPISENLLLIKREQI